MIIPKKVFNYRLPYMGSKQNIAYSLMLAMVQRKPKAKYFFDVFGGGAITTKDGTKADLSLNLYARTLAVNYLRKHPDVNAPVFVQIACCIGRPEIIVSIRDCHLNEIESYEEVRRPSELIAYYKLNKPVFTELMRDGLAAYAIKGER